jgi:hypothetical protein
MFQVLTLQIGNNAKPQTYELKTIQRNLIDRSLKRHIKDGIHAGLLFLLVSDHCIAPSIQKCRISVCRSPWRLSLQKNRGYITVMIISSIAIPTID